MKYCVVDTETSIKNRGEDAIGNNKAAPWHPDNKIVLAGLKSDQSSIPAIIRGSSLKNTTLEGAHILVGHNLRFDLHYLRKENPAFWEEWLREGLVWDTQLAEFILSGQQHTFPSLNDCAVKYGGTLKNDKIKEYWDNGIDTEDIPEDELTEYLIDDVINTEKVFLGQLQLAKEKGMLALIRTQMEALLCTMEMEWNGMYVDRQYIQDGIAELANQQAFITDHLTLNLVPSLVDRPDLFDINSNDHLSVALFGGTVEIETRVPMMDEEGNPVVFKSGLKKGEQRYKREYIPINAAGLFEPKEEWKTKKKGIYQTNEDVLKECKCPFTDAILELRGINKSLSTYFKGYDNLLWPDGIIHHNLNHCVARTGRLSSSHPNFQNVEGED